MLKFPGLLLVVFSGIQILAGCAHKVDLQPSLRMAAPPNAVEFLSNNMAPYFQKRTGFKINIVGLPSDIGSNIANYDVMMVPPKLAMGLASLGQIITLQSFQTYLAQCGGVSGPYLIYNEQVFGLLHTIDNDLSDRLPMSHSFLKNGWLALTVINSKI